MFSEGVIKTLDDFDFSGKTTLVRIDINTPINPKTGELIGKRRFLSHKDTLSELIEKKAKVVIMAHQGRPGDPDFTDLSKHAEKLSETIGNKIDYVDGIFCSHTLNEIKKMKEGSALLLENVRFYSEENIKRPGDVQAKTHFVKKLSPLIDIYVNDAFATAHRSQTSMVGFPEVLPSCAGRLMEKELKIMWDIMKKPDKPLTFVLGGTKADDALRASNKALENGADFLITGGLVANLFLIAKGYRIGDVNVEFIRGKKMIDQINIAKEMLKKHGEGKIITPVDLALDSGGERVEISTSELPKSYSIKDIGKKTVEKYREIIKKSGTIFAKGALGVFENDNFAFGTEEIVKGIAESKAFSVLGGGHLVASTRKLNIGKKINHISSGGGASISLLAGYHLPAVEALKMKK